MEENNFLRLKVIEKTEQMIKDTVSDKVAPKNIAPNQTNPIYKKMLQFHNEKIGEKFSVKDLFW